MRKYMKFNDKQTQNQVSSHALSLLFVYEAVELFD